MKYNRMMTKAHLLCCSPHNTLNVLASTPRASLGSRLAPGPFSSSCPATLLLIILVMASIGCGELVRQVETPAEPSNSASPSAPQNGLGTVAVLTSDFSVGALTVIRQGEVTTNVETTHSDAIIKSYGNLIYVVNRLGQDNLQVIDPARGFKTISQWSMGRRTNPQDVYVSEAGIAYVTLYEPLRNVDPQIPAYDLTLLNAKTGEHIGGIDLTPYTSDDGDRLARASALAVVPASDGSQLLVAAIQDRPANLLHEPKSHGTLVLVKIAQNLDNAETSVAGTIPLHCRNPVSLAYAAARKKLYVSCADFSDLSTQWGGIELVDVDQLRSDGLWISDEMLGGSPGDIEITKGYGFVTVEFYDPASIRAATKVVRFLDNPDAAPVLQDAYISKGYIQDLAVMLDGSLAIGDRWPEVAGLVFIDPETLAESQKRLATGLPPSSITVLP